MSDHDTHGATSTGAQVVGYIGAVVIAVLFAAVIAWLNKVSVVNTAMLGVVVLFVGWGVYTISVGARAEDSADA